MTDPTRTERDYLPSRGLTYPTKREKENHLQNGILGGYVSFLEGTYIYRKHPGSSSSNTFIKSCYFISQTFIKLCSFIHILVLLMVQKSQATIVWIYKTRRNLMG